MASYFCKLYTTIRSIENVVLCYINKQRDVNVKKLGDRIVHIYTFSEAML